MFERIKKALLTQHELMLYEYLEQQTGKIPYGILQNIQNTVFTPIGRRIITKAIRRWNQRHQLGDLVQRIANNGLSAEEVAKEQAELRYKEARVQTFGIPEQYVDKQYPDVANYIANDVSKQCGAGGMIDSGLRVGAGIDGKKNVMLADVRWDETEEQIWGSYAR